MVRECTELRQVHREPASRFTGRIVRLTVRPRVGQLSGKRVRLVRHPTAWPISVVPCANYEISARYCDGCQLQRCAAPRCVTPHKSLRSPSSSRQPRDSADSCGLQRGRALCVPLVKNGYLRQLRRDRGTFRFYRGPLGPNRERATMITPWTTSGRSRGQSCPARESSP